MEHVIENFVAEIRQIISDAQTNAIRSVDFCRVQMYWNIGRRIVEEEQKGKVRADYGTYLIRNLASRIEPDYGSGFSVRQLERSRQFYRLYPIASALRTQLNWMQYKLLISIPDPVKREYYELEAINNGWTGRELERQITSQLYERLLLSNDKQGLLALARKERIPEKPYEIIKDPMVLEFLGLEHKPKYYEEDLESALIEHLQMFLLEMGAGFSFVARQKRILFDKLKAHLGNELKGRCVAMWGLSFKPETDDMREAPSLILIRCLLDAGCTVRVYDPAAMSECKRRIKDAVYYAKDMYDAVLDADALLLVTEWKEFRLPSWQVIKKTMANPLVLDGRNIYDKREMEELGFKYVCIGR